MTPRVYGRPGQGPAPFQGQACPTLTSEPSFSLLSLLTTSASLGVADLTKPFGPKESRHHRSRTTFPWALDTVEPWDSATACITAVRVLLTCRHSGWPSLPLNLTLPSSPCQPGAPASLLEANASCFFVPLAYPAQRHSFVLELGLWASGACQTSSHPRPHDPMTRPCVSATWEVAGNSVPESEEGLVSAEEPHLAGLSVGGQESPWPSCAWS